MPALPPQVQHELPFHFQSHQTLCSFPNISRLSYLCISSSHSSKYRPHCLDCGFLPGRPLYILQNPVHMCQSLPTFLRENSPGLCAPALCCMAFNTRYHGYLNQYPLPPPELMNPTGLYLNFFVSVGHRWAWWKGWAICWTNEGVNSWVNQARFFLQGEGVCRKVRSHTRLICQRKSSPCTILPAKRVSESCSDSVSQAT